MTPTFLRRHLACVVALFALVPLSFAASAEAFLGRWALTIPGGAAGWLEIREEKGWYDGSILWGGGSVLPVSSVVVDGDTLTVTRTRNVERKDASGTVVRTQQFTEVLTARAENDTLRLTRTAPRNDGSGFDRAEFTGQRIPALPPKPDLKSVRFGTPISLFNGRDLSGWRLIGDSTPNGWKVVDGVLVNDPVQIEGQPRKRYGNLRTDREFEDFNLTLEVNVPAGSNSGIYLRGIYEVQVLDSHGKALDNHHMGAIYSRITPSTAAEKPAGEWQTLDLTLVNRHVTVVLNGTTIIDNQPLQGITGGAMWSDESRPGPIWLQGDHGPVSYRNLVLRPVVR
jgi:hypothetical protein